MSIYVIRLEFAGQRSLGGCEEWRERQEHWRGAAGRRRRVAERSGGVPVCPGHPFESVRLSINNPASRGPASKGRPTAGGGDPLRRGRGSPHHRRRRGAGLGSALRRVAEQAVLLEQTAEAAGLRLAGRGWRGRRARLARRLFVTPQLEVTGLRLTGQQQRTDQSGRYQHPQLSSHDGPPLKVEPCWWTARLALFVSSRGLNKKSTSGR